MTNGPIEIMGADPPPDGVMLMVGNHMVDPEWEVRILYNGTVEFDGELDEVARLFWETVAATFKLSAENG